jgi:hypothetical protein
LGAADAPLCLIEVLLLGTVMIPTSSSELKSHASIQLFTRSSLASFQCEICRISTGRR